jgi:hypothetical protein
MKRLMPEQEPEHGSTGNTPGTVPASPSNNLPATRVPALLPQEVGPDPAAPTWLQELAEPVQESVVASGGRFAYPGFASKKAGTWESLRQLHPGVKEGDAFIGYPDGQLEVLQPFKLFLVKFKQCWTIRDDTNTLEEVTFSNPGRRSDYTEEFLTLCIVITPHRMVPVVGFFGGTKAGAIQPAAQALRKAGTPEWLKQSPAHSASAKCPLPFGRFVVHITTKQKTGRVSGLPYTLGVGQVTPASLEEIAALEKALQDPEFVAEFRRGLEVYQARLDSLESMAAAAV